MFNPNTNQTIHMPEMPNFAGVIALAKMQHDAVNDITSGLQQWGDNARSDEIAKEIADNPNMSTGQVLKAQAKGGYNKKVGNMLKTINARNSENQKQSNKMSYEDKKFAHMMALKDQGLSNSKQLEMLKSKNMSSQKKLKFNLDSQLDKIRKGNMLAAYKQQRGMDLSYNQKKIMMEANANQQKLEQQLDNKLVLAKKKADMARNSPEGKTKAMKDYQSLIKDKLDIAKKTMELGSQTTPNTFSLLMQDPIKFAANQNIGKVNKTIFDKHGDRSTKTTKDFYNLLTNAGTVQTH